jgi:membrane dipeptidase
VAVVFATLYATPQRYCSGEFDKLCYADVSQANRLYRQQVDVYHRLVDDHPDKFHLIETRADLSHILEHWQQENPLPQEAGEAAGSEHPVGLVILMEGAEGVRSISELEEWWERGVRLIGPAWAGTRFCGGTNEPGKLTLEGYELLGGMANLGFTLDITHMDETAAMQAVDFYPGRIVATHSNARTLLKGTDSNRHLSDPIIHALLERNAVIGVVPFNAFLQSGWRMGDRRDLISLGQVVAQIDYICQLAGDARHVGLGTDFDGGFGMQSTPKELDTIADLMLLAPLLADNGYTQDDISAILGGNWVTFLQQTLPENV